MTLRFNFRISTALDMVAVGLSWLCLVHCLALPLLILLFPLLGTLISHAAFHQLILIAVLPTTAIALGIGYRQHRTKRVALLGLAGVASLVFAAFALHSMHAHHLETWVTVAGVIALALAHVINFRRCHLAGHAHLHGGGAPEQNGNSQFYPRQS